MKPRTTVSWPAIVALALGPLLVVGLLLGLSRPENKAVSAAVVNLDEAVTVGGQLVPMGRQLAAAMIEKDEKVDWTLADAPSAAAGLRSGAYSAVVTIPKGFSAAATSFSANDAATAEQATIDVKVGANAPVTDAQVAEQVSRLAVGTINATLTEGYLDGIYVGFNTVGEQFTTIVDGASQLHDGTTKLASGAKEASQGINQLSAGLGQLADNGPKLVDGGNKLVDGIGQLGTGAGKLADGVDEFAAQTPKLVDGVGRLADGADQLLSQVPAYADGAAQAIGGVSGLRKGLDQMLDGLESAETDTSGLDQLAAGAKQVAGGAAGLSGGLEQVDSTLKGLAKDPVSMPDEAATQAATSVAMQYFGCADDPTTPECQGTIQVLKGVMQDTFSSGFAAGVGAGSTALNTADPASGTTLLQGAAQLAGGADQLADGVGQLATELPKQTEAQLGQLIDGLTQLRDGAATLEKKAKPLVDNAPALGDGATQLLDGITQLDRQVGALPAGVNQLADGARQLADGVGELGKGAGTFVDGVEKYTDGASQAADGAKLAADGISQLADGAAELDEGVGTFATELAKGADQVPSYSQADRERLSTVVASPIERADGVITSDAVPLVSLLLTVGLWLGALAGFVVSRPVPRDVVASRASSVALWARTVWLPLAILAAQGVVLGLIGGVILEAGAARTLGLALLLAAVGVSFGLANHALAAWFGNVGRAIAGLLAAATVALGLSSSVGWLSPLGAVSPLHNAFLLVRTWLSGGTGEIGLATVALLMAAIAGIVSLASIATRRKLTARQFVSAA
ncbi:MAG: YhgE/Pip domain-containing protein [Tessaracoccus sp.]|uniref:YhgE/Pip domain-containing protein n=1 Tax=Tessaracoccus sp. TaxID=1971211 RepID=UPI001EBFA25A|nr:YhgE/Pip domain-containing protein [Tessaracoccus sp.]MBK7822230.1 YhgE/Pip domain-containing protein [Tessaracoccus sp.]